MDAQAAAAQAAQAAQLAFAAALGRIGLAPNIQQEIITYTGCINIGMLGLLTPDDISKMCKTFRTRPNNPLQITVIQEQLLLAVRFWVSSRQRLQKPVLANDVTAALIFSVAQNMRHMLEDEARADKEQAAKMPDKFKSPSGWRVFAEAMETYLSHLKGSGRIPLKYVIRKNAVPVLDAVYQTEQEESVAIAPLTGDDFQRDNVRVYGIIKQLVLEGPGRSYIMTHDATSNGRAAWLGLVAHFEGESYRNRNLEDAYTTLEALHYEGERRGFTFEKFVEKHNEAYLELERYGEPVLESKKVRDFLRRIQSSELTAAVQQVKASPLMSSSFPQAVNFIALSVTPVKTSQRAIGALDQGHPETTIALIDAQATAPSPSALGYNRSARGRASYRGRTIPPGGRIPPRQNMLPNRLPGRGMIGMAKTVHPFTGYYTPEQWAALPRQQQDFILNQRGTKRNISMLDSDPDAYWNYSQEQTNTEDSGHYYEAEGTYQEATTDVNMEPQQDTIAAISTSTTTQGEARAGNEFGQRSRMRYNDDDARFLGMFQSSLRFDLTCPTSSIQAVETVDAPRSSSTLELDSHADTCTVGSNCRIISYTAKNCHVSPYHPQYKAIENVPIVQAGVTYVHPETGLKYILIINQALYIKELPNALINPNQLRVNGLIVDDCPRHLAPNPETATHSIQVPNQKLHLPLQLKGILSYLPVHYPSDEELNTCPWIELTADSEWNPKCDSFQENEQLLLQGQDYATEKHRMIGSIQPIPEDCAPPLQIPLPSELSIASLTCLSVTQSNTRKSSVSPTQLATKWNIGLETAQRTIQATTQLAIRQAIHPLQRRFRTEIMQLRYPRLGGRHGRFHTDTFFAKTPSLTSCTMAQVYTNDVDFSRIFPMKTKGDAPDTLIAFMQDVGIPSALHSDDAKELTQGRMGEIVRKAWIKPTQSEPYSPWQVRAELCNRELKKAVRYTLYKTNAPGRLWDYCAAYHSDIRNLTAHPHYTLQGRTPYELVTGNTPDISEYTDFAWYDTVWYYDQEAAFPENRRKLAKWLGVAHRVGQALCYYLLPHSGKPIVRSTVQPVSQDELKDPIVQKHIANLEHHITSSIPTIALPPKHLNAPFLQDVYEAYEPEAEKPEIDTITPEVYDSLISAEVILPQGDILVPATVTSRKRDSNGNPIGIPNNNPLLDTRVYEVTFPDGHTDAYAANIIAQNIYSKVDLEGNRYRLLEEIINHHKDESATPIGDKWIKHGSNKTLRKNTIGWKLQVKWKDGSTSWEPLHNLKQSNPIEVAEYAEANKLGDEVAFAWWVPFTLRHRQRIIHALSTQATRKHNQKYGIEIPNSIKRAYEIDKETGTDLWAKAIAKEMFHVSPAFEILEPGKPAPIGSKWIPCHMIFDVKMDFTRKARFVAGGHVTEPPTSITYSSVVARDSVRLAFMIAGLNNLNILSADIGNAYLNAYTKERVHTTCGPEFGPMQGRVAVIRRALYGLKSSGAAWRSALAATLQDMGFKASLADPDVWMAKAFKQQGSTIIEGKSFRGQAYYQYIFVYVDDILVLAENPSDIMKVLAKTYRLKEGSVGEPQTYLGAQIKRHTLQDNPSKQVWAMSAEKYIKEAIRNIENTLAKTGRKLPNNVPTPLTSNYRPELDVSPELSTEQFHTYQQLVGILRWMVELGRIDIHLPVSLLAQHLAMPRIGHLDQVYHVFAYLKAHRHSRILLDDSKPRVDQSRFPVVDWHDFYPDAQEAVPTNAPEPLGNDVLVSCFVDADHAGNQVTRRSHTGIIIFCNRAPIVWFSKRQNTVETSSFGSEFVALRIAVELIESIRYKLRMFGIPIHGPTNVYCDNASVVVNSQIPESTLRRKHNAIAYHRVREAAAAGTIRVTKESHETNIADLLTKPVNGIRLRDLCHRILF